MDGLATLKRSAWALVAVATAVTGEAAARPLDAVEADRVRISAHLARVERELAQKDVSALAPELAAERKRNIERLHDYRLQGEFPHNTQHPGERVPYFIDRDGRVCAVGALIVASGDEALAARVSSNESNARVPDMTTPGLGVWVAKSGLSLEECARIQPGYCDESLCTAGLSPVCGKSGESYECSKVLEECSDDEYAYEGECVDGGPPDSGLVVVQSENDEGEGCSVRPADDASSRAAWIAVLGALLALRSLRRSACILPQRAPRVPNVLARGRGSAR